MIQQNLPTPPWDDSNEPFSIWGLTLGMLKNEIESSVAQNAITLKALYPSLYLYSRSRCVCLCEFQGRYPLWVCPEKSEFGGDDFVTLPTDGEHPWVRDSPAEIISGNRLSIGSRTYVAGATLRAEVESDLGKPASEVDYGGGQLSLTYQFVDNQMVHLLVRPGGMLRIFTLGRPGRRAHIWSEWLELDG